MRPKWRPTWPLFYKLSWLFVTKVSIPLKKEVIQPHLPIRLPCYDFTPFTSITLEVRLFAVNDNLFGCSPLRWCDGRCVQGPGTYSPRHADPRLLAIPTSWSRVADSNPNWERLFEISSELPLGVPLYRPLYHVCSPRHKGHADLTSSTPSSWLTQAVSLDIVTNDMGCAR